MRIGALVAYDGTDFFGFQRQDGDRTVQEELEVAFGELYCQAVPVAGAGRTDAGVHARGQVIACDVPETIPADRVALALRRWLPGDVAVRASWAAPGFDPRRDAVCRIYRYTLAIDTMRDPLRDRFALRVREGLDREAMFAATSRLLGEHDFGSFCCDNGYRGSTVRRLRRLEWSQQAECLSLEVEGDSFLYKQCRCIIGALLAVGRGCCGPETIDAMLAGRPRPAKMAVAPPTGLVLERVVYPPRGERPPDRARGTDRAA